MKKYALGLLFTSISVLLFAGGFVFFKKNSAIAKYKASNNTTFRTNENSLQSNSSENMKEEEFVTSPAPEVVSENIDDTSESDQEKSDVAFHENKPRASCPAQVLDLSNWKQTLPIGKKKKPAEIEQPTLANYSADPYFHINPSGNGIICRAPVNGVTTSNSGYPRSELREMTNNGTKEASWSTTSGTHTMYIDQAITSVPKTKKHVVAGQIHDSDDDVIVVRLEYPKLFVDINGKTGPTLDSNYTLGKRFTVKFVAENGQIKIFYNGSSNPAYTLAKKSSGNYFKAGAYTQSNCSKESDCSDNNYGEVEIYKLILNG